jgi:threonine dehydrogenase-like Zn-dependent dehydrogenase
MFDPTFTITHCVPLKDMAELYQVFGKRELGIIKAFV